MVSGGNGHRHQCPQTTDLACPTCGEFRQLQDVVKSMQEQYLQQIQLLERRVSVYVQGGRVSYNGEKPPQIVGQAPATSGPREVVTSYGWYIRWAQPYFYSVE